MIHIPKSMKEFCGLALLGSAIFVAVPSGASAEQYRLGAQDKLRVHVSEWPTLTGEVTVGANGEISLPMIGQISVTRLDTSELSRLIARRLKQTANLGTLPDTSVEVIAYRPFYILGSVSNPGEYLYRPGMLVLNAMSIAGGAYRSERRSEWDVERVAISSRGEISILELRQRDLRAELIRLNAELEDAEAFPPAPADVDPRMLRALEEQAHIFEGRQRARHSAKASLDASIENREQEITSIDQQLADVAHKREMTEAELKQVRDLTSRQLTAHRLFPLERTMSDILREEQELKITKLRTQQGLDELRRELSNLDEQHNNDVTADIQRVNAQIREAEVQERSLTRLLDGASFYSAEVAGAVAASDTPQLRYVIVRTDGNKISEIDANETTRVLPGDIVKVLRQLESIPTGDAPDQIKTSSSTLAEEDVQFRGN